MLDAPESAARTMLGKYYVAFVRNFIFAYFLRWPQRAWRHSAPRAKEWVDEFFLVAAVLLSFDRICYLRIWFAPAAFQVWSARFPLAWIGEPVDALRFLFYGFKILQFTVFVGSCYFHGDGSLLSFGGSPWSLGLGTGVDRRWDKRSTWACSIGWAK